MRLLSSLTSSFYWTTAQENGSAKNGHSLTEGNFRREAQIEFATGKSTTRMKLAIVFSLVVTTHPCGIYRRDTDTDAPVERCR